MGAWIETPIAVRFGPGDASLPTWGRGLKLDLVVTSPPYDESLPTWGRGLKRVKAAESGGACGRSLHGGVD